MVIGTGVVFAEPSVDDGVVRRLVVDPQKEELLGLQVGLELEGDGFEGDSVNGEGLQLGSDCLGERVHLASIIVLKAFIDEQCCHWYCFTKSGAWI
jgi:hypothetical protein